MRTSSIIAATLGLSLAPLAAAGLTSDVIDLSHEEVDGAAPNVIVYVQETTGPLDSIAFDLRYAAFTPSWGSTVRILIEHESGFEFTVAGRAGGGDPDLDLGWGNLPSFFTFDDEVLIEDGPDDSSGMWTITLTDIIDDPGTDGVFVEASTITLQKAGSACPADINGDGQVGSTDLAMLLGDWGAADSPADLDSSGDVGSTDLGIMLGSWGPCGG